MRLEEVTLENVSTLNPEELISLFESSVRAQIGGACPAHAILLKELERRLAHFEEQNKSK